MLNQDLFIINNSATLQEVMETITNNCKGTVIVVDDERRAIGVISDGEIRRAIIRGVTMIIPIVKIMNINFIFLEEGRDLPENLTNIFNENRQITILPILDKNKKLLKVYFSNLEFMNIE